ncbi:MAG: hypothetical protein WHV44_02930 [Anaerolineales bacterium]
MFVHIEELLLTQSILIMVILLIFALAMWRRGLFHWGSAGFWSFAAFTLYYVLNPLASLYSNMHFYDRSLALSGGMQRAEWIGFVIIIGIISFFLAYLFTPMRKVTWGLDKQKDQQLSLPMLAVLGGFMAFAAFSLLRYRTGLLAGGDGVTTVGGRFVGNTSGYAYTADSFFFFPVIFFLLSASKQRNLMGWVLLLIYVALTMTSSWNRFTVVSMLLAGSIVLVMQGGRKWPHPLFGLVIFMGTGVLVLRGHTTLDSTTELLGFIQQIPGRIIEIFGSVDSAMLSSFYLESYLRDNITGYLYGLPLINYLVFGFIPSRLFPQKYFLINWLQSMQGPLLNNLLIANLYGSKPSLMGSFYSNGGLVGVILLMVLMGFFLKRIDGMVSKDSPLIVRAIGVAWMCMLWMVWGSHDFWGAMTLGAIAIPGLVLFVIAPKAHKPVPTLRELLEQRAAALETEKTPSQIN